MLGGRDEEQAEVHWIARQRGNIRLRAPAVKRIPGVLIDFLGIWSEACGFKTRPPLNFETTQICFHPGLWPKVEGYCGAEFAGDVRLRNVLYLVLDA